MKLFIVKGEVTDDDVAKIFSGLIDAEVSVGDPEYRVMDDVDNPSFSIDFPTLEMARAHFPGAEIVE